MNLRCTNPALLIYLAWVYVIPAFLNVWFAYESDVYVISDGGYLSWLYGGLLFAIAILFAFRPYSRSERRAAAPIAFWRFPRRTVAGVLIIAVLVGINGASSGLSQWRYSADGLSTSLDLMTLLFVLVPVLLTLILFSVLFFNHDLALGSTRRIYFTLAVCLALTASGIGPMITALLGLVAAMAPLTFRRLLFKAPRLKEVSRTSKMWFKLIMLSPLFGGLGLLAYFVGEAIKTGSSVGDVASSVGAGEINLFLHYLLGRISVHWYSLGAALHQVLELGIVEPTRNLLAPVANAGFRISALLGGWLDIARPLDGSMSRINYAIVTINPINDREGTSPGLLASFVLAFPVWFGPFALSVYLWFYDKVQSGLRRRFAGTPTLFGEALLLYFTSMFFSSPVDFLLLFDPTLLYIFALCYLGLSSKTKGGLHAAI